MKNVLRPVALALLLSPSAAFAQASLAPGDASNFMGVWTITIDTPHGSFDKAKVNSDINGGQFNMSGAGTRKK